MVLGIILIVLVVLTAISAGNKKTKGKNKANSNNPTDGLNVVAKLSFKIFENTDSMIKTVNPDVYFSSAEHLVYTMTELNKIKQSKPLFFDSSVKKGVDYYKKMYYDKNTYEFQFKLVTDLSMEYASSVCKAGIVECFSRFVNKHYEDALKLKTEKGKTNRINHVATKLWEFSAFGVKLGWNEDELYLILKDVSKKMDEILDRKALINH